MPGYGLEVGSVVGWAEIPFWRTGAMDFRLPRPPATALREYVPGNLIYANGHRFVARHFHRDLDGPPGAGPRTGASLPIPRTVRRPPTDPDAGGTKPVRRAVAREEACAPLVPLAAAAGAFGDPQTVPDQSEWEWVEVDAARPLRPGMFVARVVGRSMEPGIPDGSYCLFGSPVTGTRQGRTVLVQLRDATDPDTGQRFTVKRYRSERTADADGWRHVRITLEPTNPDFEPIELTVDDEDSVAVVAELIEALGTDPPE